MSNRSIHLTTIVENNEITIVLFFGTILSRAGCRFMNTSIRTPPYSTPGENYKFRSDSAFFCCFDALTRYALPNISASMTEKKRKLFSPQKFFPHSPTRSNCEEQMKNVEILETLKVLLSQEANTWRLKLISSSIVSAVCSALRCYFSTFSFVCQREIPSPRPS